MPPLYGPPNRGRNRKLKGGKPLLSGRLLLCSNSKQQDLFRSQKIYVYSL